MKRIITVLAGLFVALHLFGQAKYVFYFIGDGMGVNMINYTQYYKAASAGQKGTAPLLFAGFPVCNVATTWSANRTVTDSAASGTALATGTKTNNSVLGLDPDGKRLTTIAELSAKAGRKVGIVSTVGANHATPGAFFAHQTSRNSYDQIILDMLDADFDFYGGSTMLRSKKDGIDGLDWKKEFRKSGYSIVGSVDEYKSCAAQTRKMLFIPDKEHKVVKAIDRAEGIPSTTLTDFVSCTVDFLMSHGADKDGFFIMAEGGIIDGCAHGNDGAATVKEILDLEEAVAVALKFYNEHPGETAIVVTADHDTGGSAILPDNPTILDCQTASAGNLTSKLKKRMKSHVLSWDEVRDFLSDNLGLWDEIKVKDEDEKALRAIYDATVAKSAAGNVTDDYGYNHNASIVAEAVKVTNSYAGIKWATRGHTASFVPVYYIGPKPELFSSCLDNSYIAPRLIEVSLGR